MCWILSMAIFLEGAVNIDSTWATAFNNFQVDTTRFPDFKGLVDQLHAQGLKVLLWATSMVNTDNPDYDFCVQNKYLLRDSRGYIRPLKWWHGAGGLLDYLNPDAVAWWHSKMDLVLDAGTDGFKCDGTDPYILEYILTGGALGYQDQKRSVDSGSDAGLIMSRPIDCLMDTASKACTSFSPKDVMFSGWVGDDDATFNGYGNFGCDIGGYRGNSDTKDKEFFLRSMQLGSFLPLMENGGEGEHRPWMYDDETVDIYRRFAIQHHRILPYLHTVGAKAVEKKDAHVVFPQPSTYSYRLGEDLLVHPAMYAAKENRTSVANASLVQMTFPTETDNNAAVWLDWWAPNDMKLSHRAGDTMTKLVPLDSYAVYVRKGAMLPLQLITTKKDGMVSVEMEKVIFTWFHPQTSVKQASPKRFELRESVSTGTGMTATAYFTEDNTQLIGELSSHPTAAGFEFVGVANRPVDVSVEGWKSTKCEHVYEVARQSLMVLCNNLLGGVRVKVTL